MSGQLTIDLNALEYNYKLCQKTAGNGCQVAAVVKADAYGLGLAHMAPILWKAGARCFFVATIEEAERLRLLLAEAEIVVLNGFKPGEEGMYFEYRIIPAICSLEEMDRAKEYARRAAQKLRIFLHLDTGTNRLGIEREHVKGLSERVEDYYSLKLAGVMSHFACADEDHEMNDAQYRLFQELCVHFPDVPKSLANSFGLFRSADYALDIARPGMALFGLNPMPGQKNPMRPVVDLKVPVLQIRSVRQGETVGYGATYSFQKDAKLAVVSLGYADGFLRALSNKGHLYWKDYALPIRGRVSMDQTVVDLSEVPEKNYPQVGDMLEVIGTHQSADDLAEAAGTIGYEILTGLGTRYHRVYA